MRTRPDLSHSLWLAIAVVFLAPAIASAQGNVVARITQTIDETRLTTVDGNTHPLARPEFDRGAAPADLPTQRMLLVLRRSAEQESALETLLEQQRTPLHRISTNGSRHNNSGNSSAPRIRTFRRLLPGSSRMAFKWPALPTAAP